MTHRSKNPPPMRGVLLAAVALCVVVPSYAAARPPNLVFLLTDNHGAWTLGCYGNPDVKTPHIDQLAAEGMRFTRAYSSNPVCPPTRATYLTGLIPSQHGVHTYLRGGGAQVGPEAYNTLAEFRTLPRILSQNGYTCGLVGKWHLGKNLEPQEGFTRWITMPAGHTASFYDADVIEDGKIRKEQGHLTDLWSQRGVRFIDEHKDRPFFLMLAFNGPYGLGKSLLEPLRSRRTADYADAMLQSFPRAAMHPWQFNNKEYLNNVHAMRQFASELANVDDAVGAIMAALARHRLDDDTVVVFAGDQGWVGGQNGLWGMGDHTRPLSAFDGMLHVPLIFRHRGKISAGATSDKLVSNYDFLPSVLSHLGLSDKWNAAAPRSKSTQTDVRPAPARDYSRALVGQPQPWDDVVYFEFEVLRGLRTAEWKYIERFPDGPHELYDLKTDAGERFNLFGQPQQAKVQAALRDQLAKFFAQHAEPEFDLWRGGRSKAHLISAGGAFRLNVPAK